MPRKVPGPCDKQSPRKYPDEYPGDDRFTEILQEMLRKIMQDNIDFTGHWLGDGSGYASTPLAGDAAKLGKAITGRDAQNQPHPLSRQDVCKLLVERFNTGKNPGMTQTNAQFSGCGQLTEADCSAALTNPQGFTAPHNWDKWKGSHRGTWYDIPLPNAPATPRRFDDEARWHDEREVEANDATDTDSTGQRRRYRFQDVEWPNRCKEASRGWNQSHPEVGYVWGWDPKELTVRPAAADRGKVGAHLGLPFSKGDCHYIIWFTQTEVFLESINPTTGKKTSTGLTGFGQWAVS